MTRSVLILIVVVGIGYGGWSLIRPGASPSELSSTETTSSDAVDSTSPAGVSPSGPSHSGGEAGGGPAVGSGSPGGADSGGGTEVSLRDLLAGAKRELEAAAAAGTRGVALERKDRARRLLSEALFAAPPDRSDGIRKQIDALTDEVVFSEQPLTGKSVLHTFRANDLLWNLCRKTFPQKYGVRIAPGFLLWVNGLSDPRRIREGQILKVPTEELSLRVSKSRFRLWVLLGGAYVREFPVGIGASDKTPEGRFVIETKQENPVWYEPRGGKVPFGDPRNPLGTRWMGFKRTRLAAGYGIHGTTDPDTIGKAVSEGCIRMRNRDVEELFDWVPRGTAVVIQR